MSDVFISYARATSGIAQRVADALRDLGFSVWRDDDLPAHRSYAEVIEERLNAARAVVVIWCADAARSEWVQSEADRARQDGKLVQMRIGDASLPMPFDRIQCADLTGWTGDASLHDWQKVVASVTELVGRETPAAGAAPSHAATELPALPAKPSIAVMPFANLSNDPEQAYFVEGMVEEIVGALSRFKTLFVVSAGSSMVSRGRELSPQEAAQRLGVNYLLEGSVRKAAGRARITVHVIDAKTGEEVWSDRLEDTLEDIFALQDRVAAQVAGVVETRIEDHDEARAERRPTTNLTAYEWYLRALPLFRTSRRAQMLESIAHLDRAIELDPNFTLAHAQSVVNHRQVVDHRWCDDIEAYRQRGLQLADHSLKLGWDDARCVATVAAGLPGLEGRSERALTLVDRALSLNSASSFVWLISGSVRLRIGEPELAAQHLETGMRLDPISSMNGFMRMYLASARFQQSRFDEALALYRTTTLRLPISYAILAALHGHRGEIDLARAALEEFHNVDAGTIEDAARVWFPRGEYRKLFTDGIALAEGRAVTA